MYVFRIAYYEGMNLETEFTPIASLAGGILIGVATVMLFLLNGRIAGISGILSSLLPPEADKSRWVEGLAFVIGLLIAIPAYAYFSGSQPAQAIATNLFLLGAGGLLVGVGAALGSGCTSGHGVCGISRLSTRSMVATITFMLTAALTVFAIRHLIGGF